MAQTKPDLLKEWDGTKKPLPSLLGLRADLNFLRHGRRCRQARREMRGNFARDIELCVVPDTHTALWYLEDSTIPLGFRFGVSGRLASWSPPQLYPTVILL